VVAFGSDTAEACRAAEAALAQLDIVTEEEPHR
jgi:hypothetical protein